MPPQIKIKLTEILSQQWYVLKKVVFDYQKKTGDWETHTREVYDRGNGVVILLYSKQTSNVILTKQFRMPTYLNGNASGMLIEACAGLIDHEDVETCIRREAEEETGYAVENLRKVFEIYMSPGAVSEKLHFFVGEYSAATKIAKGGGLENEQEEIEVLELPFSRALEMVGSGEIQDGKTIILLQYAQLNRLL